MSFDDRIEYYLENDPSLSYEEAKELVLQEDEDLEEFDNVWADELLYGDDDPYWNEDDDEEE